MHWVRLLSVISLFDQIPDVCFFIDDLTYTLVEYSGAQKPVVIC